MKPIRVLNNKDELLRMVAEQQTKANYHALYRANVNVNVSDLELSFIDIKAQRCIIAAAIWRNNNKGIIKQSRRRTAFLKRFIMQLLGIRSLITITKIINKIASDE